MADYRDGGSPNTFTVPQQSNNLLNQQLKMKKQSQHHRLPPQSQ